MSTKITTLTDKQRATFLHYVDKWTAIGLSTERINREKHDIAVARVYALANLNPPKMIYTPCPLSGALAVSIYSSNITTESMVYSTVRSAVDSTVYSAVYSAVYSTVDSAVYSTVDSTVYSAVDSTVYSAVYSAVYSTVRSAKLKWSPWLYGNQWAGYAASADFFQQECSIDVNKDCLDMMECGHFIWPFQNVCFASEKPVAIHIDDTGRSHSENSPAIEYASGWGPYCWHGTVIPAEWITDAPPTAATAIKWDNMEQRRCACEMVGWVNILAELNAVSIDKHDNPMVGELLEVEIPDIGREKFLQVKCGTNRLFALPVPPEMKTAEESQRWLNFVPEDIPFLPGVRT